MAKKKGAADEVPTIEVPDREARVLDLSAKLKAEIERPPDPGVWPGVDPAIYHRWNCASNSRLSLLKRSPAHLLAAMTEPPAETEALFLGKPIHCAVLEPDMLTSRYVVAQQCDATKKGDGLRCTNVATTYNDEKGWLCGVHGKGVLHTPQFTLLTPPQMEMVLGIRDSVQAHKRAKALLSGPGENEWSIAWDDPETGLRCKARLDRISPILAGGVIADVKSTTDARESAFMQSLFKYGYFRQSPFYMDGLKEATGGRQTAEHFVFIAVEKKRPYATNVFRVMDAVLDAGRADYRPLLRTYAECVKKNEWPAYGNDIVDLALPDWAWSAIAETEEMGA